MRLSSGRTPESTVAFGEVHPCETGVEAGAAELPVVQRARVVRGEQRVDCVVRRGCVSESLVTSVSSRTVIGGSIAHRPAMVVFHNHPESRTHQPGKKRPVCAA